MKTQAVLLSLLLAMLWSAQPLSEPAGFEATFEQKRTTPGLERAFKTGGRVIWQEDERLEWRTETPFEYSYILYPDRIVEKGEDGEEKTIRAEDAPWIVSLNELLLAVMSGDEAGLAELFSVDEQSQKDGLTHLVLIPTDDALAQQIPQIELYKDERPRRIIIKEADQGQIDISLSDFQGDVSNLPELEPPRDGSEPRP